MSREAFQAARVANQTKSEASFFFFNKTKVFIKLDKGAFRDHICASNQPAALRVRKRMLSTFKREFPCSQLLRTSFIFPRLSGLIASPFLPSCPLPSVFLSPSPFLPFLSFSLCLVVRGDVSLELAGHGIRGPDAQISRTLQGRDKSQGAERRVTGQPWQCLLWSPTEGNTPIHLQCRINPNTQGANPKLSTCPGSEPSLRQENQGNV